MRDKKRIASCLETKTTSAQQAHWKRLDELFHNRPLDDERVMMNLGLYIRSSALAKILFLHELYELILTQPGVIMEFGTWVGQNLVVFENLRAIYEPFNQSRRIIAFDTFTGYTAVSEADGASKIITGGGYALPEKYKAYLETLIDWHEKNNVLGHIKKHAVIEGDVTETVPHFFSEHPETIIALAYFDLALYKSTKACLEAIRPHLLPGSVIMLDEFGNRDYPGETLAWRETFEGEHYKVRSSRFMPGRTIITME